MTAAEQLLITTDEYLEGEKLADTRHEYIDGEVYAMAGAGDAHVKASGNIFALLKSHIRGSGCSIYMSDMKVKPATDDAFFYPDVMICCEDSDKKQNYIKQYPIIIIEVLSPSTEAFDRGEKFARYRQIPNLKEYVLIDPSQYNIDVFRLNENNRWELFNFSEADAKLVLSSLNFQCSLADVYEDIDFNAEYIDAEYIDAE